MNRRRERANTLALVSVITAALLLLVLYFAVAIAGFEESKGEHVTRLVTPTRPQTCAQYILEHDPSTWDEETETYPRNVEWEDCMGVGRK